MNFEPVVSSVSATPVVHEGVPLVVLTVGDRAHVVDRAVFDLLFRPIASCCVDLQVAATYASTGLERMGAAATELAAKIAEKVEPQKPSATKRVPASKQTGPVSDLSDYPSALRDPRAETQRGIYDALQRGPLPLVKITEALCDAGRQIESSAVMTGLQKLRDKGLAKKLDASVGGDWILC